MKLIRSLIVTVFASIFIITLPNTATACEKGHDKEEILKKYDANGDGKLDDTEKAAAKKDCNGKNSHEGKKHESKEDSSGSGSTQAPPL